jgi:hypothetical protein
VRFVVEFYRLNARNSPDCRCGILSKSHGKGGGNLDWNVDKVGVD